MRRSRTMEESPATMASTGDGLVQKIFFPSYLDAGFDESFTLGNSPNRQSNPLNRRPQLASTDGPIGGAVGASAAALSSSASSSLLDRSITESVGSEASTAIRDNRSNPSMPPAMVAHRKKNKKQQPSLDPANTKQTTLAGRKPNPPSFFASTKPTIILPPYPTNQAHLQQTHPLHPFLPIPPSPASEPPSPKSTAPASPPKVARHTHASSHTVPTATQASRCFPFDPTPEDSHESFQDASSIAIVSSLNHEQSQDMELMPSNAIFESDESSSATSLSQSKPHMPCSIFDDTTDNNDDPQTAWEEEATPAQTAFGKQLLFQRVLRRRRSHGNDEDGDCVDDISSTASENGSLVDYDGPNHSGFNERNDLTVQKQQPQHLPTENDHDASNESAGSAGSSQYATPLQDEPSAPKWDDGNLNLPELDTDCNNDGAPVRDNMSPPLPQSTIPTEAANKKLPMSSNDSFGTEEKKEAESEETPKPASGVNAATGLLSMAIRRLGTGLTTTASANLVGTSSGAGHHSMSAPTTPRASSFGYQSHLYSDAQKLQLRSPKRRPTLDVDESSQPQGSFMPSSFLLRSPGSIVFQDARRENSTRHAHISPRFSYWQGAATSHQNNQRGAFKDIPEHEEAALKDDNVKASRPVNTAFQIARSCFSFDAYDTSVSEHYDAALPNHFATPLSAADYPAAETLETSSRQSPDKRPILQSSASWDLGYSPDLQQRRSGAGFRPQRARVAFRPRPAHVRGPFSNAFEPSSSFAVSPSRNGARAHMSSDYSPPPASGQTNMAEIQELKSPQRIEIERDDAIDILACLVERGVSWKHEEGSKQEEQTTIPPVDLNPENDSCSPSVADISAVVKELQDLSLAEERLGDFHNNSEAHRKRKLALEELLRSHEYALEMKRASQSASSWLKSIGRSQSSSPSKSLSPARNVIISEETTVSDSPSHAETSETEVSNSSRQAAGEDSSASENIDLLTAKAMLHSAQMEVKEKSELADRLNEELAKCRAEIGRLKTSAQSTSFRSPNRSILDESDDISVTEGAEGEEDEDEDAQVPDRFVDESDCIDSSFLREGDGGEDSEVMKLRSSLAEANSVVETLCAALNEVGDSVEFSPELKERMQAVSIHQLARRIGQDAVMNDSDNFVSNWAELDPPLLGPPEHSLRSPIVDAVLQTWTDDRTLHESLLSWFDGVLDGGDLDSIPPLTLTGLEPQVRDGFVLHVLPLLRRRLDLYVDVRTRAQRSTVYDILISIDDARQIDASNPLHGVRQQPETTSAMSDIGLGMTDSTSLLNAADRVLANGHSNVEDASPLVRLSHDEMSEEMAPTEEWQPGIMSALGGAIGGLLSRRKGVASNFETMSPNGPQGSMQTVLESPASVGLVHEIVGLVSETDGEDQPYHRVVSAPPGRIGVTFVEYRGHCMVSDVHPDSPLVAWIWPSDVLIAIDNLPVSGMRVRDIIKVLKDRTNSQRALRVISSHAMSEFTLNASAVVDEAG